MYCEPEDVKLIIETSLTPDEIGRLIYQADKDLDNMLGSSTMDDELKKRCSSLLTAIMIADKQPKDYTTGSTRISHGEGRIKRWKAKVDELVARATSSRRSVVKSSAYQVINEDRRYPQS